MKDIDLESVLGTDPPAIEERPLLAKEVFAAVHQDTLHGEDVSSQLSSMWNEADQAAYQVIAEMPSREEQNHAIHELRQGGSEE